MSNWSNNYIRIPFVDGGRTPEGVDCWGMLCLIYRDLKNVLLASYAEISAHDLRRIAAQMNDDTGSGEVWRQVTEPHEFDVVVMSWYKQPRIIGHVGIYLGRGFILHTEEHTGPVVINVRDKSIKTRVQSYWRHRELDHE